MTEHLAGGRQAGKQARSTRAAPPAHRDVAGRPSHAAQKPAQALHLCLQLYLVLQQAPQRGQPQRARRGAAIPAAAGCLQRGLYGRQVGLHAAQQVGRRHAAQSIGRQAGNPSTGRRGPGSCTRRCQRSLRWRQGGSRNVGLPPRLPLSLLRPRLLGRHRSGRYCRGCLSACLLCRACCSCGWCGERSGRAGPACCCRCCRRRIRAEATWSSDRLGGRWALGCSSCCRFGCAYRSCQYPSGQALQGGTALCRSPAARRRRLLRPTAG